MGFVRLYESFEQRPTHPLTGAPADYYWEHRDGTRTPHWRKGHLQNNDPALSWFSLPEVAKLLGKSRRRILQLVKSNDIPARKIGTADGKRGTYYVSGKWILDLAKTRPDMGSLPEPMEETKR